MRDFSIALSIKGREKKQNVLMLSTMHGTGDESNTVELLEIIQFYNSTKRGVDMLDQLCHSYSCARKTYGWPLFLFYNLLNITGHSSSSAGDKEIFQNSRSYLKTLAVDMMRPDMLRRLENEKCLQ
ncbi:uncharacterized protein LOC124556424 [Schistocerca americana]|uniref:uncharacterized protein LOC124556424 n=1 Tax=Schistocerca americana TaxID=7009 RepID=UPI001F4FCE3D|nr:uncharacterized protein LOC124556424 [Schistocerca americana]